MNKVPELRFNEFNEEWEEKSFQDLFDFFPTNSYSRVNLNNTDGKVHNIHYGDVHMKFSTVLDFDKVKVPFINKDIDLNKYDDDCYCKDGDLVIVDASEDYEDIGKAIELKNIADKKVLAGLHTFLARDKSNLTIDGFRGYVLLNDKIKLQIKKIATGISVLGISKTNLNKVVLNIPSLEEQKKIANFISKVDEKIAILEDKLQLWETYKKGIMQQLFSQELRFTDDDGNSYPDWEEKKIGDLFKVTAAGDMKKENFSENKNTEFKYPLFGNALDNKGLLGYSNLKKYPANSITLTARGNIGVSFIRNKSFNAIGRLLILIKENEFINNKFFSDYINSELTFFIESTGVPQLTSPSLRIYKVKYPKFEEQEKIANFLSNIDEKIQKIADELKSNKKFKKGLLQKMFC